MSGFIQGSCPLEDPILFRPIQGPPCIPWKGRLKLFPWKWAWKGALILFTSVFSLFKTPLVLVGEMWYCGHRKHMSTHQNKNKTLSNSRLTKETFSVEVSKGRIHKELVLSLEMFLNSIKLMINWDEILRKMTHLERTSKIYPWNKKSRSEVKGRKSLVKREKMMKLAKMSLI